jgi:predicted small lipoprotein YifL
MKFKAVLVIAAVLMLSACGSKKMMYSSTSMDKADLAASVTLSV